MNTFIQFQRGLRELPLATSWMLNDIAEMKGRQQLFTQQSPQKLKVLREHAVIESTVSSNRIEGVQIDDKRIGTVIFGCNNLKDRNEEEIRGYRQALDLIHAGACGMTLNEALILELHRLSRGEIWDSGKLKNKDGDIIETYADGRQRLRFRTVSAADTPASLAKLLSLYHDLNSEQRIPPLIALAAFNLDFLCIHPFRDGNGRVSRLLLLLELYHHGFEAGRYISLEKAIEDTKAQYYETLELSSQNWHEQKHNPWYYINYLLFVIKSVYKEFESRVEGIRSPKGSKTELIVSVINPIQGTFSLREIESKCPGVSRDMIRAVLKQSRQDGLLICEGRGPGALWRKKGNTSL
ncbi:MAG: Fic family protein [Lentisphaerota bacterium]